MIRLNTSMLTYLGPIYKIISKKTKIELSQIQKKEGNYFHVLKKAKFEF